MLSGHEGTVQSARFHPKSTDIVATAGQDGTVRMWDVQSGREQAVLRGHDDMIHQLRFAEDGRLLSASRDRTVRRWNLDHFPTWGEMRGHTAYVHQVHLLDQERLAVSAASDGHVALWDVATGARLDRQLASLPPLSPCRVRIAPISERSFLSVSSDGFAHVWQVSANGLESARSGRVAPDGIEAEVQAMACSKDASRAAVGDRTGAIWTLDLASLGRETLSPGGDGAAVRVLAFDDEGRLFSGNSHGVVTRWDGDKPTSLWTHDKGVEDIVISPTGQLMATAGQGNDVIVSTTELDSEPRRLDHGDGKPSRVAFSPDEHHLATVTVEGHIRLWRLDQPAPGPVRELTGHRGRVWTLDFDAEGRFLVSTGADREVHIDDITGSGARRVLRGHRGAVVGAALTSDRTTLLTTSLDQSIRRWELEPSALTDAACALAGRELSETESQNYFDGSPRTLCPSHVFVASPK